MPVPDKAFIPLADLDPGFWGPNFKNFPEVQKLIGFRFLVPQGVF